MTIDFWELLQLVLIFIGGGAFGMRLQTRLDRWREDKEDAEDAEKKEGIFERK